MDVLALYLIAGDFAKGLYIESFVCFMHTMVDQDLEYFLKLLFESILCRIAKCLPGTGDLLAPTDFVHWHLSSQWEKEKVGGKSP